MITALVTALAAGILTGIATVYTTMNPLWYWSLIVFIAGLPLGYIGMGLYWLLTSDMSLD